MTAIVVTRDGRDLALRALESIEDTRGRLSVETIVVDNASRDGTPEAIEARFPDVLVVRRPQNEGFARAANRALGTSRGRFALLLNSDAALEPGALEALASALDARPDAGAAGAQLVEADGSRGNSADAFPSAATELTSKAVLRRLLPRRFGAPAPGDSSVEVGVLLGACLLLRREAVARIGLLDERFFFYFEDADLSRRMEGAGFARLLVPGARARHVRGASAYRDAVRAKKEYHLSRRRYFEKHHGAAYARALEVGLTLRLAAEVAGGAILAPPSALVAAAFRGASGVDRVLARLRLQAAILGWRMRGAPGDEGLERAPDVQPPPGGLGDPTTSNRARSFDSRSGSAPAAARNPDDHG